MDADRTFLAEIKPIEFLPLRVSRMKSRLVLHAVPDHDIAGFAGLLLRDRSDLPHDRGAGALAEFVEILLIIVSTWTCELATVTATLSVLPAWEPLRF